MLVDRVSESFRSSDTEAGPPGPLPRVSAETVAMASTSSTIGRKIIIILLRDLFEILSFKMIFRAFNGIF